VQNVISLDANSIENSQVIFGPGSVMYGSDAIGGVMDFHTLSARLSSTEKLSANGNAMMRFSSANREKTGHADVNLGWKKWGLLTSVTYSDYDNLQQGSHGPEEYLRPDYIVRENNTDVIKTNPDPNNQLPSGFSQVNLMQKARFRPSTHWDLQYAFHHSQTSRYDRYDRLILRDAQNALVSAEWYYGPQEWLMHALKVSYLNSGALFDAARFTVAFQNYHESRHNRNRNSVNRNNRFEQVKAWSANLDMDKTVNDRLQVFYGVEGVTNTVYSSAHKYNITTETQSALSTRYPNDSDCRSLAAYLSLKIKLSEPWLLTVSNRFTYVYTHAQYDTSFYDFPFTDATLKNKQITSSLGLIYSPVERWKVFANFSTGFRAPNIDDIGKVFDSQPGNVVVPNPYLNPETAYTFEVGAAVRVSPRFSFDAGVYYTQMDNAIARAPATFNGQDSIDYDGTLSRVLSLQNVNELYVFGMQAGLEWRPVDFLKVTSSLNLQKGKEKDFSSGLEGPPAHVAPSFGATHVWVTHKKFTADIFAVYNGQIEADQLALSEQADAHLYANDGNGNPYAPSWWTLNAKFSYVVLPALTLDAGVENIFDKRYRPYASGISAPGINFILALRGRF
jgi:hemoglobin/transferrin/lactoferrin receptor protein